MRTSFLADMLGMNVQTVASVHTASGLLVYIQAAVHIAVASEVSNLKWENLLDFHGFLVSSDLQKKDSFLTPSSALLAWQALSFLSVCGDHYSSSSLRYTLAWRLQHCGNIFFSQ